jgi:arylsulfatase A
MPAMVRWPGRIAAGERTAALSATYDIFPTMLSLASVPLPTDRIIDGKDLSPVLFASNTLQMNGEASVSPNGAMKMLSLSEIEAEQVAVHECLYFYGGTPGAGNDISGFPCVSDVDCPGLWAARCGKYKVHWVTSINNNSSPQFWNPPLLYDIMRDPSELHPIWPNNENYASIVSEIESKRAIFESTMDYGVPNYIMEGESEQYALCCNPDSQSQYPEYPPCTCSPDNWEAFVCTPLCESKSECGAETEETGPLADDTSETYYEWQKRPPVITWIP